MFVFFSSKVNKKIRTQKNQYLETIFSRIRRHLFITRKKNSFFKMNYCSFSHHTKKCIFDSNSTFYILKALLKVYVSLRAQLYNIGKR